MFDHDFEDVDDVNSCGIHNFDDVDNFLDDDFEDDSTITPAIQWAASKGGNSCGTHSLEFGSVLDSLEDWEYAEHRFKMRMQKILRRKGVKSALLRLIEQILALDPLPALAYGKNDKLYGMIHSPYIQPLLAIRTAKRWKKWHDKEMLRCTTEYKDSDAALHKLKSIQFKNMLMQARMTRANEGVSSKLLRGSGKMSPDSLIVGASKSDFGRVVVNSCGIHSDDSKGGFKKQRIRHTKQRG